MPIFVKGHKRGKSFVKAYIKRKAFYTSINANMAPQAHLQLARKYNKGLSILSSPSRKGKPFVATTLYKRHVDGFNPHKLYRGLR